MKINQVILWRVISAALALAVSLSFYWLTTIKPDYTAALLFVSFIVQVLIYIAYKNRFP